MMFRAFRVVTFLAWQLTTLLLRKIWRILARQPQGKALFLANYEKEGFWALSHHQRSELARYSGCIQCGLCEQFSQESLQLPQDTVNSIARPLENVEALSHAIAKLNQNKTLQKCEEICPVGIPFSQLQQLLPPNNNDRNNQTTTAFPRNQNTHGESI